ncbi:MAG: hypothetical protein QM500_04945 [Methylococcales bacterium]
MSFVKAMIYDEQSRRNQVLKAFGLDVEGWGLLNSYSIYDEVFGYCGAITKFLIGINCPVLARYFSNVQSIQIKAQTLQIWQEVSIISDRGSFKFEGWIHDQEPLKSERYIYDKYFGVNANVVSGVG